MIKYLPIYRDIYVAFGAIIYIFKDKNFTEYMLCQFVVEMAHEVIQDLWIDR